uniref:Reverse transcriptase (RNA-dependent DNA polymerase) n=1 Tax=Schistocephalus solidus TaxID=70667 RepID=A0A0X3NUX1_SCHSO
MGIFATLKQSKDPAVLKALNGYLRINTKLVEAKVRARFIGKCVEGNEYPNFYWRALRRNRTVITCDTLRRYAENDLESIRVKVEELGRHVCQRGAILDHLDKDERQEFEKYVVSIGEKRGEIKIAALLRSVHEGRPQSKLPEDPSRYVHNLSSISLDKTSIEALSLGPKFCCPRQKPSQLELETQFENLLNQTHDLQPVSTDSVQYLKSTLVNCSYQYLNNGQKCRGLLTKSHMEKLKELRQNKDVLITRPDKGMGVVLMDRTDYIMKLEAILSDKKKFIKTEKEKDRTDELEAQLTDCLKRLQTEGLISENDLERLRPVGTHVPRLYGLPKIHKDGTPVRPILDMKNSPYHAIAKWLADKLKPIQDQLAPLSYRDTFEFVEGVKDFDLNGMTMFSLDVSSLFTNVPVTETVNYICEFITSNQQDIGIPVNALKELLLKCTLNVQFLFNNTLYRQIDGVAMGSPLGPLLANIFMGKLEALQLRPQINRLKYYGRYADDIFAVASEQTDISAAMDTIN